MSNTYMSHPRTMCAARPCRSPLACEARGVCREAHQGAGYEPMDTATALYEELKTLPRYVASADLLDHLPQVADPAHVARLLEDDDPNATNADRYLAALAARTIRRQSAALERIIGLAGSCIAQRAPNDDAVIAENIEAIDGVARVAHRGIK